MSSSSEGSGDSQELEVAALRQEVDTLKTKLGVLHGTDVVSLRRAYNTLTQHVSALEGEWDGALEKVDRIQTTVVSPEFVAQELGVAGAITLGVSVLQHTLRGVVGRDVLGRAAWFLGAGLVAFRLAGGVLARWAVMAHANARLRREILRQLQVVDERIRIMAALRAWTVPAGAGASSSAPSSPSAAPAGTPEPTPAPPPQPQLSSSAGSAAHPGNSSGSSSSMEILEHSAESPGIRVTTAGRAAGGNQHGQLSREALRRYAQLGGRT